MGMAYTWVYAGDKKIDGVGTMPLSPRAQADMQSGVNSLYGMFTSAVARNRGMSQADVTATQAGMYMSQDAINTGLADRINSFSDELNAQLDADPDADEGGDGGDDEVTQTGAPAPSQESSMSREIKPAGSAAPAANNPPVGVANAGSERARIAAIMRSPEAVGRTELAEHLAYESDMTVDAAVVLLAKAPKAAVGAAPASNPLAEAMQRQGTPAISPAAPAPDSGGGYKPAILEGATLHAGDIYGRRRAAVQSATTRSAATPRQ
jgi:ClpP class serine protease